MPGLTNYSAQSALSWITGTPMPTFSNTYVGLFITPPTAGDGTGGTECSGNGYSRVATANTNWNAPTGATGTAPNISPAMISNANTITFPTATGSNSGFGNVCAIGLFTANTGGNLLAWDYIGPYSWSPVTMSAASPGVVALESHGFANGDPVAVTTKFGGTLPTNTAGSFTGILYVAGTTSNTFTLLSNDNSTAINTSTIGDFQIRKLVIQSVPAGGIVTFSGGTPGAIQITTA